MSRAFVKEGDGDSGDSGLPDRPVSPHPNYVTPDGLEQLRQEASRLEALHAELQASPDDIALRDRLPAVDRDLRYFRQRVQEAIEVPAPKAPVTTVQFGCTVEFEDQAGKTYRYRIVGEDQADAAHGLISWVSPLARALKGKAVDDEVLWERPSGSLTVTVTGLEPG